MITTHVKVVSLVLLVAGALTTGFALAAAQGPDPQTERSSEPPTAVAKSDSPGPSESKSQSAAPQKKGSTAKKAAASSGGQPQPGAAGAMMMMQRGGGMGGMGGGMGGMMGGMGGAGGMEAQREYQGRLEIAAIAAAMAQSKAADLKTQSMMKTLDQPLTMSFANPTPLEDVLKYIREALKDSHGRPIPIYVDPRGLKQAESTLSSTASIDLDGVPLKTSLRLILKQLGLAYCVRDGVLIISSVQGIREELAEAASELSGKDPELGSKIMQSMNGMGGMMGGMGGMGMM